MTSNPYKAPPDVARETTPLPLAIHRGAFCVVTVLTAAAWAVFPIEQFPFRRLLIQTLPVSGLLMAAPAFYWESFCRENPLGLKRSQRLSGSLLRCMIGYMGAFLVCQSVFEMLAGPRAFRAAPGMTPAMQLMYVKHGIANACTVLVASAVLVLYDVRWSKQANRWADLQQK